MAKLIDCIEGDSSDYEIEYRIHATRRMFQRDINEDDVEFVVRNGEVVERYEQDFSLPSLLLLGESQGKKPLHIVVGIDSLNRRIFIITAYEPDPNKWTNDFSKRLL